MVALLLAINFLLIIVISIIIDYNYYCVSAHTLSSLYLSYVSFHILLFCSYVYCLLLAITLHVSYSCVILLSLHVTL